MTPRYWKPLVEVPNHEFKPPAEQLVKICMEQYRLNEQEARAMLDDEQTRYRFFVNEIYQVQVAPTGDNGDCLHLNIRRRDGGMIKDWRHFQEIKNQIAGPDREAVEIYPAEDRKVDTCNKWHLWVLPEGHRVNFGWEKRDISYNDIREVPGLRQRPL